MMLLCMAGESSTHNRCSSQDYASGFFGYLQFIPIASLALEFMCSAARRKIGKVTGNGDFWQD